MPKQSVTIRAAWITAGAMLLAALVAGLFGYMSSRPAPPEDASPRAVQAAPQDAVEANAGAPPTAAVLSAGADDARTKTLDFDIPAGSTITIHVTGPGEDGAEEIEATIRKELETDSSIRLLESPAIQSVLNEQDLGSSGALETAGAAHLLRGLDYVLAVDANARTVRLIEVSSSRLIWAGALD